MTKIQTNISALNNVVFIGTKALNKKNVCKQIWNKFSDYIIKIMYNPCLCCVITDFGSCSIIQSICIIAVSILFAKPCKHEAFHPMMLCPKLFLKLWVYFSCTFQFLQDYTSSGSSHLIYPVLASYDLYPARALNFKSDSISPTVIFMVHTVHNIQRKHPKVSDHNSSGKDY